MSRHTIRARFLLSQQASRPIQCSFAMLASAFDKPVAPLAPAPPLPPPGTAVVGAKRARDAGTGSAASRAHAPETAERQARTLFVGNVPTSTAAAALARLVQGAINAARASGVLPSAAAPPGSAEDRKSVV